jgi:hypothetical protein
LEITTKRNNERQVKLNKFILTTALITTLNSGGFCVTLVAGESTQHAFATGTNAFLPEGKRFQVGRSPITYQHIVGVNPNHSIFVVKINLTDPGVSVRVSPGGLPPIGESLWLTTLLPPSEIAARDHYDIAINGDFFDAKATKDIEGKKTGYIKGKPAAPIGMAMTDGRLWHRNAARPYLEIAASHTAEIVDPLANQKPDSAARQIIGGGQIILRNGVPIKYQDAFATDRHPRTAVGVSRGGKWLTFLIVDGRQPSLSIGMTLAELSSEMIRLGCDDAINLDGGGSTTLVYRDPATKRLKVLNSPSDGKERSVADVLGVTVGVPLPEPN